MNRAPKPHVAVSPPDNRAQDRGETETNFPNAKNQITIMSQTIMYKTQHPTVSEVQNQLEKNVPFPIHDTLQGKTKCTEVPKTPSQRIILSSNGGPT